MLDIDILRLFKHRHHLNSLKIDFVYLKFCLEDPRSQYSASQQVLEDRGETGKGT